MRPLETLIIHQPGSGFSLAFSLSIASPLRSAREERPRAVRNERPDQFQERKQHANSPLAPLGTKPHAIGASLFLIEYDSMDQAVLLYDQPGNIGWRHELAEPLVHLVVPSALGIL